MTTPKRPISFLMSSQVEVTAGKCGTARSFYVHEELLTLNSTYFEAAFRSEFKEADDRKFCFTDVNSEVVGAFVSWLYTDKIFEDGYEAETERYPIYDILFPLWTYGDRIGVPSLQNAVINAVYRCTLRYRRVPTGYRNYIYENTVAGGHLRTFFVTLCARLIRPETMREKRELIQTSGDFLFDLSVQLCEIREEACVSVIGPRQSLETLDLCTFHIHQDTDCKGAAVEAPATSKKATIK